MNRSKGIKSAYEALLDTYNDLFTISGDGPASALMKGFYSFYASIHEDFELSEDDAENYSNLIEDLTRRLKEFTTRIREWANNLIPGEDKMKGFQNIFQSIFSAAHIITTLLRHVNTMLKPIKDLVKGIVSRLLIGAGEGESLIVKLDKFLTESKVLSGIEKVASWLSKIVDIIFAAIDKIGSGKGISEIFSGEFFADLFSQMLTGLVKAFTSAKDFLGPKIEALFDSIISGFSNMKWNGNGFFGAFASPEDEKTVKKSISIFNSIKSIISSLALAAKRLLSILPSVLSTVFKWIEKIDFATLAMNVKTLVMAIVDGFGKIFSGGNKIDFMTFLLSFIDMFFSGLEAGVKILNAVLPVITKVFNSISRFLDSLSEKKMSVDFERLVTTIRDGFQAFVKALTGRDTLDGVNILTDFLEYIFAALKFVGNLIRLIMSLVKTALDKANEGMSKFKWNDIKDWFTNFKENILPGIRDKLSDIRAELILFSPILVGILGYFAQLQAIKLGKGMIKSIKELAKAFDDMFGLKDRAAAKKIKSIALLVVAIAGALAVLAFAIYKLSQIQDSGKLWGAVGVIGAITAALTAFMVLTLVFAKVATKGLNEGQIKAFASSINSLALVMAVLGGVIFLIAYTMERLSEIDNVWEMYGVIAAIWGLLALFIAEAALIAKKAGDISSVVPAMLTLVACIAVMTLLVKKMSDMNQDQKLLPGLLGLVAITGILTLFLAAMAGLSKLTKGGTGMLAVGGSLLMFAGAMLAVALVLQQISAMTINVDNLLIFGAVLGIMLVAMAGLSFIGPEMLVVAAALLTFATAAVATALAMFLAAEAVQILSTHIGDIVPVIHELVVAGLDAAKTFIEWIIENIPLINQMLTDLAYMGIDILFKATMSLLQRLSEDAPAIAEKVIEIIISILNVLIDNAIVLTEKATELGMCVVIGMMQGLSSRMGELLDAAVELVVSFIDGLGNALFEHADEIHAAVQNFISGLLRLVLTFFGVKGEAGDKISRGLGDLITNLGEYLVKLAATAIRFLGTFFKNLWAKIKSAFTEANTKIKTEIQNVWNKVKDTLNGWKDKFKEIGKNILEGLINGFKELKQKVVDTVTGIGDKIQGGFKKLFGIESPSKVFREYGQYMDEGLILGLNDYSKKVENSAEDMGNGVTDAVSEAISRAYDLMANGVDMDPTIRPILDLSNIQNGIGAMNGMLAGEYSLDASANYARQVADAEYASSTYSGASAGTATTTNNNNQSITNTFNISGDDPREIAEEVSRIIQQQIGRRNTVWA